MGESDSKKGKRLRVGVRKQPEEPVLETREVRAGMEPVHGEGPVRRIIFEDEGQERTFQKVEGPAPEPEPEQEPEQEPEPEPAPMAIDRLASLPSRPRGHWGLDDIHREVDRLHRNRTWGRPLSLGEMPGTIYTTNRGSVREDTYNSTRPRRLLYVSQGEGSDRRERRFISSMVDRVIQGVSPGQTPSDRLIQRALASHPGGAFESTHETRTETVTRRTPTGTSRTTSRSERRSGTAAPGRSPATADDALQPSGPSSSPTSTLASKDAEGDGALPEGGFDRDLAESTKTEYQPQCGALTLNGAQCRNSSRMNSKYCSSHRNYRARGAPENA